MIIQEINNTQVNKVKLHCEACKKTLFLEDYELEPFAPGIIDLMQARATQHEQKHPTHNPTIWIYKRKDAQA